MTIGNSVLIDIFYKRQIGLRTLNLLYVEFKYCTIFC